MRYTIFKCLFVVVFRHWSHRCYLCVSSVWFQCTPGRQQLPSAQPKQSADIKRDFVCRALSWLWPLTRTCPLLRNELWRLRREPCGGQHGKFNTQHILTRKIKWLIRFLRISLSFYITLHFVLVTLILTGMCQRKIISYRLYIIKFKQFKFSIIQCDDS